MSCKLLFLLCYAMSAPYIVSFMSEIQQLEPDHVCLRRISYGRKSGQLSGGQQQQINHAGQNDGRSVNDARL